MATAGDDGYHAVAESDDDFDADASRWVTTAKRGQSGPNPEISQSDRGTKRGVRTIPAEILPQIQETTEQNQWNPESAGILSVK